MPNLSEHIRLDILHFGWYLTSQYWWVNKLLDNPWCSMFGKRHRAVLHNREGVEAIRMRFGDIAAEFAEFHIAADLFFSSSAMTNSSIRHSKKNPIGVVANYPRGSYSKYPYRVR
jgi:hypothetical protein